VFMLYKQKFIVGPQDVPEANKDEPHPGCMSDNQRHRGGGGRGGRVVVNLGNFYFQTAQRNLKPPKFLHKLY